MAYRFLFLCFIKSLLHVAYNNYNNNNCKFVCKWEIVRVGPTHFVNYNLLLYCYCHSDDGFSLPQRLKIFNL